MKKRMLLLGMAIWMAAALTGCGNDTTDSTDQATAADQEQSENATDKTQTDGSQTDANIEQAATGAPLIQMDSLVSMGMGPAPIFRHCHALTSKGAGDMT